MAKRDDLPMSPVGEVLAGLELMQLPEGYTPLDAVAVIKAIDSEGDVCWFTRHTKGPHAIEFLGGLQAAVVLYEADVVRLYEPDDEG